MSGQIKIAFRTRDEPIEDVALNARELEGDDARVARELAITVALDGDRTAADLLRPRRAGEPRRAAADARRRPRRGGLADAPTYFFFFLTFQL